METLQKRRGRPCRTIPTEDLPNRARPLRISLGMSLMEVAAKIGVTSNQLSEFEIKGTGIQRLKQYDLAEALGVDYGSLMIPGKIFLEKLRQTIDTSTPSGV